MEKVSTAKGILKKNNYFLAQLLFLVLLSFFANGLFSIFHLKTGSLYWDHARLFNLFRDSLHSLNYFGEIQWWNPVSANGFPTYYFSILGNNGLTPVFIFFSVIAWFFGVIGIHISSYHMLYVICAEIVIPFLFVLSLFFLSRQILRQHFAILLVIILGCFSPSVIFNLGDFGVEQSTYGIFFVAAFLKIFRYPSKRTFFYFWIATLTMAISVNHLFLYWTVLFVPLFIILMFALREDRYEHPIKAVYFSVHKIYWMLLIFSLLICILPTIITYSHGSDILRSTLSDRTYSFLAITSGNPLEIFTIGTPDVGFNWVKENMGINSPEVPYAGYTYLGVLSIPLVFIGLMFGRNIWKLRFLVLLTIGTLVFLLGSYSPLFSLILGWPTPLRSVSHFSDTSFRLGISYLLILIAGFGFEVIIQHGKRYKELFFTMLALTAIFSTLILYSVYDAQLLANNSFGFFLAVLFFSFVLIYMFFDIKDSNERFKILVLILFVIFIDVSTISFGRVRKIIWESSYFTKESPIESVGMKGLPGNVFSETLFVLRDNLNLEQNGTRIDRLPELALFNQSVDQTAGPAKEIDLDKWEPINGTIDEKKMTYNSLLINVDSPKEATLFWKDSFFPFWKVQVDGENKLVKKIFGAFKGVNVPKGRSTVLFYFSPGILPQMIALSYLSIVTVLLWGLQQHYSIGKNPIRMLYRKL